jgi:PAS domain S-box-containing protein
MIYYYKNALLEIEVKTAKGNWYMMRILPYRTLDNVIEGAVITFVDITDRKHIEKKLEASEIQYRRLFESAKDGILILDADTGQIVDVNPYLINLLGYSYLELTEKKLWQIGHFNDAVKSKLHFAKLQSKDYIRYDDLPMETYDGRTINVEFISNVYLVDNRRVIQCNIRDITERKIAEKQIRDSEEKYRTLITKMQLGLVVQEVILDKKGKPADFRFIDVNSSFERVTGLKPADVVGKTVLEVWPKAEKNLIKKYGQAVLSGNPVELENFSQQFDKWFYLIAYKLDNYQFAVIIEDITVRKQSDEKIKDLLDEKELLLQETHHRIKNNMGVIYSLLSLQARTINDVACKTILQEAAGRVHSMLLLYNKLYRSDIQQELNLKEFLIPLVDEIVHIFKKVVHLNTELHVEDIWLSSKILAPLGIILNECITNSMKYAFKEGESGTISISATQQEDVVTILYADGEIMKEPISFTNIETFGLRLIKLLVKQINGEIRTSENKSKYVIEFPK